MLENDFCLRIEYSKYVITLTVVYGAQTQKSAQIVTNKCIS